VKFVMQFSVFLNILFSNKFHFREKFLPRFYHFSEFVLKKLNTYLFCVKDSKYHQNFYIYIKSFCEKLKYFAKDIKELFRKYTFVGIFREILEENTCESYNGAFPLKKCRKSLSKAGNTVKKLFVLS
jgi:hypothetical protein